MGDCSEVHSLLPYSSNATKTDGSYSLTPIDANIFINVCCVSLFVLEVTSRPPVANSDPYWKQIISVIREANITT